MKLALFDLDGTLTRGDTFLAFMRFYIGNLRFWLGMLILSPVLIAFKLKLIPNQRAKEIVFGFFFQDEPLIDVKIAGDKFCTEKLKGMLRLKGFEKLQWHQRAGHTIAIVTASSDLWLEKWAIENDVHLIATEFEVVDEKLSGKIAGKNCYGEEKVRRIKESFALEDFEAIYAYGDTPGDRPMLALADEASYKPFR